MNDSSRSNCFAPLVEAAETFRENENMALIKLLTKVKRLLGTFPVERGFTMTSGERSITDAYVSLHDERFRIDIFRYRGCDEWICIESKVRPRPRAHLRGYLLCRIIAYLDGTESERDGMDLKKEIRWLIDRADEVLDTSLLNSEELRMFNLRASRRMWAETKIKGSGH